MAKIISILLIALSIISCSQKGKLNYTKSTVNGIEVITNENRPADSTFKVEMKELFTIEGNSQDSLQFLYSLRGSCLDFDSLGNVFILDSKKQVIHKYNPQGKQLLTFGRKGRGPGEMAFATALSIVRDSVFLFDQNDCKIIKFNTDGKYAETYPRSNDMIYFPKKYGKYLLDVSTMGMWGEKETITIENIKLFDTNFKFIKSIYKNEIKGDSKVYNSENDYGLACVINQDSNLCLVEKSTTNYQINILDFIGNKKQIIRKKYREIIYSSSDLEKMKKKYIEWGFTTTNAKSKPAIMDLKIDKFNRLWVKPSTAEDNGKLVFDIFEKNVFQNRVTIPSDSASFLEFKDKYIVILNEDNKTAKIYDYK